MPVRGHQTVEDRHEVITGDGAFDLDRQRSVGELVGDGEDFEYSPVGGLVEREIGSPHMVGELRLQPVSRGGGRSHAGAFAARNPHA